IMLRRSWLVLLCNFCRMAWLVVALWFAVGLARADEDDNLFSGMVNSTGKAYQEATAKVEAATTPIEKINALYQPARLPEKGWGAFGLESDWKKAAADIEEALQIVAQVEADGNTRIDGKATLYFQKGYVADELKDYAGAIVAYNDAEKWGYDKLYPDTGGA